MDSRSRRMTLADAIKQADRNNDSKLAAVVAERLSLGRGYDYNRSVAWAERHGVSAERWEELMYMADCGHF